MMKKSKFVSEVICNIERKLEENQGFKDLLGATNDNDKIYQKKEGGGEIQVLKKSKTTIISFTLSKEMFFIW